MVAFLPATPIRKSTSPKSRRHRLSHILEQLEDRTLLSSTFFVYGGATDSTHFNTLQAALAAANNGDIIHLQSGYSSGNFISTSLSANAAAGDTSIHTTLAMDVGDVVSISASSGGSSDRDLVTAVTPSGTGDFILTLASPLQFAHSGSTVDATNTFTTGPIIGLNKSLTIIADTGAAALPYNLEIWHSTTGLALTNLQLTGTNTITLDSDAHANTLSNLTVSGKVIFDTGSNHDTLSNSTVQQVRLNMGSHDNSLTSNTIASLIGVGGGTTNSSGHDSFQQNTFTGPVTITGNSTADTADSFLNNIFTVSTGDALTLNSANATTIQSNTFNQSTDGANSISVHNSGNVIINSNTISSTGSQGIGIYAFADASGSTSVDITNNTVHTTDGIGIYLAKYSTTANMEARVQSNTLTSNAMGVYLFGDGASAGTVDLGGGSTRFGTSSGNNDFSTFSSDDAGHFAIGIFATTGDFNVSAHSNIFSVADPHSVIADTADDLDASATGFLNVTAARPVTPPPPPVTPPPVDPPPVNPPPVTPPVTPPATESITLSAGTLTVVQTGTTCASVAHFTDNLDHKAKDFTATITWPDGTTSTGRIVCTRNGSFEVLAPHRWFTAGSFTFTVTITAKSGLTATAQGSVTVTPRVLKASGINSSTDRKSLCNLAVATFTDNLHCTSSRSYVVTITWSDGTTSTAQLCRKCDGTFTVKTSRALPPPGTLTGTVNIATLDGLFSTSTTFTLTVKAPPPPPPPPTPPTPPAHTTDGGHRK